MNTHLVKKFLSYFGKNKILCYNHNVAAKSKMIKADLSTIVNKNSDGHDVYFYINTGGTKKHEMTPVACYVDLDAGRNKNKKYKTQKEVNKLKKNMLEKIKGFVRPTFIIETRNGYQVYWVLTDKKVDINNWNAVQAKICNYFKDVGSDSICSKINQIYRIPTSMWCKRWENITAFRTRFIHPDTLNPLPFATNEDDLRFICSKVTFTSLKNKLKDIPAKLHSNVYSQIDIKVESPVINPESHKPNPDTNLLLDIKNFLLECSSTLFYTGKKYSATQARELAEKLSRDYCV